MLDGFGSLGIDNWPRMTLTLFLLASPPNAASGKRNVMQKFTMIRLFTAVAGCWQPFQKSYLVAESKCGSKVLSHCKFENVYDDPVVIYCTI